MIYVTGDTHGNFRRFTKKNSFRISSSPTAKDYVIVCGDLGLLWQKDKTLEYNLDWLSRLPFTLLWVQGNHENYNLIAEYPISLWNGGKVRHIIQDKIILLERGQVFNIDGKTFFTFGGASSHDIQGGIFDRDDPDYKKKRMKATKARLNYRVLNISWWSQELPSQEEMDEGRRNLEGVGYAVDYVITHCLSTSRQKELEQYYLCFYEPDILTEYLNELEEKLQYKQWYCGHYHEHLQLDEKHTLLSDRVVPIKDYAPASFEELIEHNRVFRLG